MSCLNLMLPVWHLFASVYNSSYCAECQGNSHTDRITPKLCVACYVVMSGFYITNRDPLKEDYFASLLLWERATSVPTTDKQVAWQEHSICHHRPTRISIMNLSTSKYLYGGGDCALWSLCRQIWLTFRFLIFRFFLVCLAPGVGRRPSSKWNWFLKEKCIGLLVKGNKN